MSEDEARRLAEKTDKLLSKLDKEQTQRIVAELRKAQVAIAGELALAAIQGEQLTWNSARLAQLLQQIDLILGEAGDNMAAALMELPDRAADIADQYASAVLKIRLTGAFGIVNRPAIVMLQQYNLGLIKRVTDDLRAEIRSTITQGIIQGQSIPQIARQLTKGTGLTKGTFPRVEKRAVVIARTETIRAFSQGVQWQFQQHGIHRVRWMTARDERVCKWCGPLDGLVFPLGALPMGGPPLHPQCRCFIRPVIAATEEEGNALDIEAARNAKEQRKRFDEYQKKKRKAA